MYDFLYQEMDLVIHDPSVKFSSVARSCLTLWDPVDYRTPGLPVHHQLQEFTQTHVHWVSDAIQPSHPLIIPLCSCLQSFPASGSFQMSQFFTSGSLEYWSFSFSISPYNEHSGLISFRIDWMVQSRPLHLDYRPGLYSSLSGGFLKTEPKHSFLSCLTWNSGQKSRKHWPKTV